MKNLLRIVLFFITFILSTFVQATPLLKDPLFPKFINSYLEKYRFESIQMILTDPQDFTIINRYALWSSVQVPFMVEVINASTQLDFRNWDKRYLYIGSLETKKDAKLLKMLSDQDVLRNNNWLVVGNLKKLLDDKSLPYLALDNKLVFAEMVDQNSSLSTVSLSESYQAARYLPYITALLGQWNDKQGLQMDDSDFASRRTNLTGLHLRCVSLSQPPFLILSEANPGEEVKLLNGFIKEIWDNLQDKFLFEYTCRTPKDNEFGSFRNGEWTGLIKELVDHSADVIITSLDLAGKRSDAVDFTIGLRNVGYRMAVIKPGLMSSTWTSFTSELGLKSWGVTIAMMIITPLCLSIVTQYSPHEEWKVSFSDAYILTIGALAFQGSWINVSSASSRVIFITIFLGTLLIYSHYTSALVAQLTVASKLSVDFTTLQGLLDDGQYNLGFKKGISIEDDFRTSRASPFYDLWKEVIEPNEKSSITYDSFTGLQKVKDENYVFLIEENEFLFQFYMDCEVMLLNSDYFPSSISLALTKNSPYVKVFNDHLMRLKVTGILERFWQTIEVPPSQCTDVPFIALSINQTFTAFLVLVLGLLLSLFFCLPIERLAKQYEKNTKVEKISPRAGRFNYPHEPSSKFLYNLESKNIFS